VIAMKRPLTEVARDVAVPLVWLEAEPPLRQVHQQACICAECEAMTQHVRMVAEVNAGRYEVDE
jgi:hypothetical protein